jgi:hypothetical protein
MWPIRHLWIALLPAIPAACTMSGKPADSGCQTNAAACHDLPGSDKGGQGNGGVGHGMGGGGMGM